MPRTTERLPHDPYIDAVIRAVREADDDTGPDRSTDYATEDGEAMLREAFIDLGEDGQDDEDEPVRTALARRQITGWLGIDYDGHGRHGRHEHAAEAFADDGALPAPAAVADFVRAWFNGPPGSPTPGADDTTPSDGPLPAPLATALENGDVTADLARRLAPYGSAA
ncbi:hypothetical protein OG618_00635 [Kitasatospora sp. NBC_01246]|uniref:hypothetical protein n=1 Tax=Kitasatospora sp. NBC_01246 TaxID=2903570 RepID=UPI002E37845E|nr:hypothetical protein [Kitasatospora sp. NBC_01246]